MYEKLKIYITQQKDAITSGNQKILSSINTHARQQQSAIEAMQKETEIIARTKAFISGNTDAHSRGKPFPKRKIQKITALFNRLSEMVKQISLDLEHNITMQKEAERVFKEKYNGFLDKPST